MDPPTLLNHSSYSLAEIWPFALNGGGSVGESNGSGGINGGLELRTGSHYGQIWGHFTDNASGSKEVSIEQLNLTTDQRGKIGGGAKKRRDVVAASEDESTSGINCNINGNLLDEKERKRINALGSQDDNHDSKAEVETRTGKHGERKAQPSEQPKQDYIHVRARRGQATDSHSLAERARREKISERMKILQDLVPGCNKVIGKALVLDEIINYIQSLQRQVEFLSMKLEAVNTRNPDIEGFPSKDYGQQTFENHGMAYGAQAAGDYVRRSSPDWLHMQVGGRGGSSFERT